MPISRAEVEKVALLARLLLSEEELAQMTVQLGAILQYMDLLAELNTDQVEPLAHPLEITNVFRADEVRPSLARQAALANAPHHDEECYLVPAVLGEA